MKVIPNFVDINDLRPLPKENAFSLQYGVRNKFLISYAGNLGPAQGLEEFIEAAAFLQNEQDIHFMMIGDGILRETLEKVVDQKGLNNFTILPFQPYSLMPLIYGASNICLVPQAVKTGCDAVPSKVYRIMACARPIIASTDLNSDLAHLVTSVGCGVAVEAGSSQALADMILSAFHNQDLWRKMGEVGSKHVVGNYARSTITKRYNDLIRQLTDQ